MMMRRESLDSDERPNAVPDTTTMITKKEALKYIVAYNLRITDYDLGVPYASSSQLSGTASLLGAAPVAPTSATG